MKKFGVALLIIPVVVIVFALMPNTGLAGVDVNIGINIPFPGFVFPAPPAVVLIPGSYVYTVPDVDIDILFYQGHWYRPHGGRWYRSNSYNGPWGHIDHRRVPGVILGLPPGYRHVPPEYQRIPYGHLKSNWRDWERQRYWDTHEYRHEQWERHNERRHEHYKEERRDRYNDERPGHRNEGNRGHRHDGREDR